MAKSRKKPAITDDAETVRQALDELGIDRPVMLTRVVGGRIELTLYGGDVVIWPPKTTRARS